MSALHYDRATGRLFIIGDNAQPVLMPWAAANFVDSKAVGPWPVGTFKFLSWEKHPSDGPDSPFGTFGILIFAVAGREGMGVHSGRARSPDQLGRVGICHATFGCIRTTDQAMAAITARHATDPLTEITVT